jgi:hydroxyacylglutathione hydrolase
MSVPSTGTSTEMFANMKRFRALPPATQVFSGHEYTKSNLRFAAHVCPGNEAIKAKLAWCDTVQCTQPSTIQQELDTNVFLRAATVEELGDLRTKKDNF